MGHKQEKILNEIFKDPPSANIHWRDVESLLKHLGAEMEPHGGRLHVILNRAEAILHRPHHGSACSKTDVKHLRGFLASAGVFPSTYNKQR